MVEEGKADRSEIHGIGEGLPSRLLRVTAQAAHRTTGGCPVQRRCRCEYLLPVLFPAGAVRCLEEVMPFPKTDKTLLVLGEKYLDSGVRQNFLQGWKCDVWTVQ